MLGRGYGEPIAYEGALKIKEITYLHAEGYPGGALKHGPFALIEGEKEGKFGATPIILIVLNDEHATFMKTAAESVRARGAHTIIITDNPAMCENIADEVIPIPTNGPMTALLATIPLQLIAYELAVLCARALTRTCRATLPRRSQSTRVAIAVAFPVHQNLVGGLVVLIASATSRHSPVPSSYVYVSVEMASIDIHTYLPTSSVRAVHFAT